MPANENSGKLLILGVLAIGLAGRRGELVVPLLGDASRRTILGTAGRHADPRRAARDVAVRHSVRRMREGANDADVPRDISSAKGLTHLRNALLEDASYDWTAAGPPDTDWSNSLVFAADRRRRAAGGDHVLARLQLGCERLGRRPGKHVVSTSPIADGLREVLRRAGRQTPTPSSVALPAGSRLDAAGEFPIIRGPADSLAVSYCHSSHLG